MKVKTIMFMTLGFMLLCPCVSAWENEYMYCSDVAVGSSDTLNGQVNIILQGNDKTVSNYIDFDKLGDNNNIMITDSTGNAVPYWLESLNRTAKTMSVWVTLSNIQPASPTSDGYKFQAYNESLNDYGLGYPVTYEFSIPTMSSGLTAYKRYSISDDWVLITEKTSNNFFNGIEAVRFDYDNNTAYVSAAFGSDTNEIYIKVTDGATPVGTYKKISKYYDNRSAAVVVTVDDWWDDTNNSFCLVSDIFAEKKLWFTPGIIPGRINDTTWNAIQEKINTGYIEPAGHSYYHDHVTTEVPYLYPILEIDTCKQYMLDNITMPENSRRGSKQYIHCWIEPFGQCDAINRVQFGKSKYLIDRSTGDRHSAAGDTCGSVSLVTWDSKNGLYQRSGYTEVMGSDYGVTSSTSLNLSYDEVYNAGGIYHLMFHPIAVNWTEGSYADVHLDHIANHLDVWYVGFGHLYLYDYTRQFAMISVVNNTKSVSIYYGTNDNVSLSNYDNIFTRTPLLNGCLSDWNMDSIVGTTVVDSLHNHNGTMSNVTQISDLRFANGSALKFNGINSSVACGQIDELEIANGSFTIEAVFNVLNITSPAYQNIVGKGTTAQSGGDGFTAYIDSTSGRIVTTINDYSTRYVLYSDSSRNLSTGTSHHLMIVYDNTTNLASLYLDGVLSQEKLMQGFKPHTITDMGIGKLSHTQQYFFNGSIDAVRAYNIALTRDDAYARSYNLNHSHKSYTSICAISGKKLFNGVQSVSTTGISTYAIDPDTTNEIDMSIIPENSPINVSILTWTTEQKIWNESSEVHNNKVTHTIGGFPANTDIDIYRDGIDYDTVTSNSTGYITWVYDGGFSEHTFEAVPHATAGVRDSFVDSWGNTVSMVGAIIVIALAGSMIMMFRGKKDLSEVMNDLPGIILIVVLLVTGAIIFGQF